MFDRVYVATCCYPHEYSFEEGELSELSVKSKLDFEMFNP